VRGRGGGREGVINIRFTIKSQAFNPYDIGVDSKKYSKMKLLDRKFVLHIAQKRFFKRFNVDRN